MTISDAFSIYSPGNRRRFMILAALLAICIALVDWRTESCLSLGFPHSRRPLQRDIEFLHFVQQRRSL